MNKQQRRALQQTEGQAQWQFCKRALLYSHPAFSQDASSTHLQLWFLSLQVFL